MNENNEEYSEAEECTVCGIQAPHEHSHLIFDETWGLIPADDDIVKYLS